MSEAFLWVITVRGSIKNGRRPYIVLYGAIYTNDFLKESLDLIGKKNAVYVDPEVGQFVTAFSLEGDEDGSELGILTATGMWGRPHTLMMRKVVLRRMKTLLARH